MVVYYFPVLPVSHHDHRNFSQMQRRQHGANASVSGDVIRGADQILKLQPVDEIDGGGMPRTVGGSSGLDERREPDNSQASLRPEKRSKG